MIRARRADAGVGGGPVERDHDEGEHHDHQRGHADGDRHGDGGGRQEREFDGERGALAVNNTVTGGNVTLSATGAISETGTILATQLAATTTTGDITLGTATNNVADFAASDTDAASGNITFNDSAAGSLTLGSVAALSNVTTTKGNITITSGGTLTVTDTVTAGGGKNVSLTASGGALAVNNTVTGGNVTLSATGAISETGTILATQLAATTTTGDITLGTATNNVADFAASDTDAASGNITFNDSAAGSLTLGSVAALSNVTTTKGNITITSGGTPTVTDTVTAGGGKNVSLTASGGRWRSTTR